MQPDHVYPLYPQEIENRTSRSSSRSSSSRTSSSSTTTMQTSPIFDKTTRQSLSMEALKTLFADVFDRPMPRSIAEAVLRDLREGTPSMYYRYAMEETLLAPRPSWRYTLAIVARLKKTKADQTDSYDR